MSAEPTQPQSGATQDPGTAGPERPPAEPADKVRPRSFWRALPMIAGALVVVLAAAAALLVLAPPTEFLKGELIRAVRDATGRELAIEGPAKFTVYPRLGMELRNVTLSGPPGAAGAELLRAEAISAEIRPWSLVSGPVEISRIDLRRPALTIRPEDKELVTRRTGEAGGPAVRVVTITDGSVNYLVKQPNPEWRADQVTATVSGLAGGGEARANGQLRWRTEPVTFTAILSNADALWRGAVSPLNVTVDSKHLAMKLEGEASGAESGEVRGMLTATSGSLRDLLRWLDADPGAYALKGPATLAGAVTASAGQVRLERHALKLDAGEGTLDAQITHKEARPQITGSIAWRQLDLDRLIGEAPKLPAIALQTRAAPPGPTIHSGWDDLAAELGVLGSGPQTLAAAGAAPQARGAADAWARQAFDFKPLALADLNLTATADAVKYGGLEMRRSRSEIALREGRLSYTLKEVEIDKGRLTGRVDVDSAIKPARVALSLSASDVAADSILSPFLDKRLLTGRTKADVVVSGRGRNAQELIDSLEGTANVSVEKGEIVGFNLRRALLEWWKQWTFDQSQKTRFDRLSASYGIKDGVMRSTNDLAITGGEIEISSNGIIALPSQTLDQRLKLRAVPPPVHWPVPLRIGGSWSKPSISWDWLSVLKSPASLGAPNSVAPSPEPMPAEVKAAIEKVLKSPSAAELPEEGRALLQSLLAGQ